MSEIEKIEKVNQINREIEMLEKEHECVKGTETEVYTRIVGYFRAVDNWNKGKREEYDDRVEFSIEKSKNIGNNIDILC